MDEVVCATTPSPFCAVGASYWDFEQTSDEQVDFVGWLREHNDRAADLRAKAGFYGLDLYSLHRSADEVISYLGNVDPDVAGTIGAVFNNANGIAGIAPATKILPVRVLGTCGGTTSDIADAITWASGGKVRRIPDNPNPAKAINLSLGGSSPACGGTFQKAINGAVSRGTTVVVAAGNSNSDVSGFTPANCKNVVSVASNDRAFHSNYGAKIDMTAPGGEVRLETDPPGSRTIPQNGVLSTLNAGAPRRRPRPTRPTWAPAWPRRTWPASRRSCWVSNR